jgi:hypothetical protein
VTETLNHAGGATGRERVLAIADRIFPLFWLLLYLLLPVTGAGAEALATSFDQSRDLEALRSVLADGRADAIAENLIGPAYIATAAAIHTVTGLSPEDSLIALTRVSYALSAAVCLVVVRATVRRLVTAPSNVSVSLVAQSVFMALVFAAGTWHWSDVPWSHFYATLLAVSFYALRFAPATPTTLSGAAIGGIVALLALTRSFEFMAVVVAWILVYALIALAKLRMPTRVGRGRVAVGVATALLVGVAVYAATGKRNSFLLYESGSGEIYGDLRPEEVASIPSLDLVNLPRKAVQIFVDPCFYSLCSLHEYAGIRAAWRQPLVVQLPALVLLPLCLLLVGFLTVRAARRRGLLSGRPRELTLLAEMTVAACGLTLGYLASSWSSSSALRFGFARDFMLASLLSGMVAVCIVTPAIYLAASRRGGVRVPGTTRVLSPVRVCAAAGAITVLVLMVGVVVARTYGLPRLNEQHLETLEYAAVCEPGSCRIEIAARNYERRPVSIPQTSLLTFGCGSDEPVFTLHVEQPSRGVVLPASCVEPRLVAAWPTIMGVPPSSSVLRAVRVSNA